MKKEKDLAADAMRPTHFVVLDFEATCDENEPPRPQEIIEFPSVLLDAETFEVVDEFESFVRPIHHPTLRPFCTELTSITQAQVDGAPTFPEVMAAHLAWLQSHGLPIEGPLPYVIVTCGDWDLKTMLPNQLAACDPPIDFLPEPYRQWLNVKVPFKAWNMKKVSAGMARMLELLGIELVGHHHRGIDDSRNIAKLVRALAARHQTLGVTAEVPPSRYPVIEVMLERGAQRAPLTLSKRVRKTLLGGASGVLRAQARKVFHAGRELTEDRDLFDLRPGDVLQVE